MPAASALPDDLLGRPFTVRRALEMGVSRRVLDGRRFRRPFRGIRVWHELPDDVATRYDAARLLLPPHAFASHVTAGALMQLPVPDCPQIHVWLPWNCGGLDINGITIHRWHVRPATFEYEGRTLTGCARTFIDCADLLHLVDLVVLGDAALRRSMFDLEDLRWMADVTSRRHIRTVRQAAALIRAGVDSPPETRTRLLLVLAGLPEPQVGRDVHWPGGGWIAKPDLSYPEYRIAIEYDGRHHADDPRQWRRDILRRENLAAAGWIVIQVTAYDLYQRPLTVIRRVMEALHQRRHPQVPEQPSWDWQPYF